MIKTKKATITFIPLLLVLSSLLFVLPTAVKDLWINIDDANYADNQALFSNTAGSKIEYNFTGNSLTIVTQKRDDFGIMNVYLDGSLQQIDLYSKDVKYGINLDFSFEEGLHNLVIEVSGEKNSESSGYYILVDDINFDEEINPIVLTEPEKINSNKIHKDLENFEGKKNVLAQIKSGSKEKVKTKLNNPKFIIDQNIISAEIDIDELNNLIEDEDVIKIWPDLETQSFVFENSGLTNVESLWALDKFGAGTKIAIIDSGLAEHELFNIAGSIDFTGTGINDIFGHGTHVAGIASVMANESLIYNVKVLNDNGVGSLSWLINGIDWAIANDMDIISLSLGAIYSGSPEDQLGSPEVLKIEEAIANGITVVIASGNCGSGRCGSFDCVTTPGIARNAITVGAVDSSLSWASFSSGCSIDDYIKPDLVAPGVNIYSSIPTGYATMSGTSMATPFVTGAVALISNSYSPLEIKSMLETNAVDLGVSGKDVQYGSGFLNLENILDVTPVVVGDYNLIIPVFEIGSKDKIILEYHNDGISNVDVRVNFWVEELDNIFTEETSKNVPADKTKEFFMNFEPQLPGKHVLKVQIYENEILVKDIKRVVSVIDSNFVSEFEGVSVR